MPALEIAGTDNYGKPRQNFADRLFAADDAEIYELAERYIWLSAYAANNPSSDYHWMADAAYDECVRRDAIHIYKKACMQAIRKGFLQMAGESLKVIMAFFTPGNSATNMASYEGPVLDYGELRGTVRKMDAKAMIREWKLLSDEEKAAIRDGIEDGSLTY